ncbi:MAG: hypothetical protein GC190_19985 [Alphaproteobacteria bacterium]|nr:hypothetical protein [Alphaproteobacteria bacterium]
MINPSFDARESKILKDLAAAKSGDEAAARRLCETFTEIGSPQDKAFVPLLRAALNVEDQDVRLYAICCLGAIGEAAVDAMPQLLDVIEGQDPTLTAAAAVALRSIPGKRAIEGMVRAFEKLEPAHHKTSVLASLSEHGPDVEPYLPRLEAASERYSGFEYANIASRIRRIRSEISHFEIAALPDGEFAQRVPLYPPGEYAGALDQFYEKYRIRLNQTEGLIYRDRFRFSSSISLMPSESAETDAELADLGRLVMRRGGEVGIDIYRTSSKEPSHVVVLSADRFWFGASPQDVYERLATAVVHVFSLDPQKTVWVERWARDSGRPVTGEDEFSHVNLTYDPRTDGFDEPTRTRIADLEKFLRDKGVRSLGV